MEGWKVKNVHSSRKGLVLSDIKLYYKVIVMKALWLWPRGSENDQKNRGESPEMDLLIYVESLGKGQFFFFFQ